MKTLADRTVYVHHFPQNIPSGIQSEFFHIMHILGGTNFAQIFSYPSMIVTIP